MQERLKNAVRRLAQNRFMEHLVQASVNLFVRANPECLLAISAEWHGVFKFPLDVCDSDVKLLDEIPSEATQRERHFLYRFFSSIWSGENDIIEIGPYLGGTTRAIALGMCNNPRVSEKSKLYTCDRFRCYHDPRQVIETLRPLVHTGGLKQSDLDGMGESVDFFEIFKKLHSCHDYFLRIRPIDQGVPDRPTELLETGKYFQIMDDILVDAVFIDGCKSWFGTKYFMSEVCKASRVGTFFIFQDYGWYTCFWIPTFTEVFKDYFKLIGYVDTTYAFILVKPLNGDIIREYFPDTPSELGEDRINAIFKSLIGGAVTRNDYSAVVRHSLQNAGAIAYIGNREKAKKIITAVKKEARYANYRSMITAALRSPTYTPDGEILL
jgi:hypothetical protein